MNDADIVYDPARAADLLGVSASGLRRLAPIYESVFGDLKRVGKGDESKRSREWTTEAVGRLQAARQVTGRGRPYRTIEAALEAIREGVEVEGVEIDFGGRHAGAEGAIGETLQVLLSEIQALRLEVAELRQDKDLQPLPEIKNSTGSADEDKWRDSLLLRLLVRLESFFRR
jgi:molybdenum-dependent DNA-binding transcriptional regulator ModE